MKIIKYSKLKKNKYRVLLDDDSKYDFYDDIILKYGLLLKKELSKEELDKMIKDNSSYEVYEVAATYLTKRLRTKSEIIKYLRKKEYSENDINKAIQKLEERKLINDLFVATCYMNDQINFNLKGPYKIKDELEKLGVSAEIIDHIINESDPRYQENINKIIEKKVKTNHKLSKNMLINKIKNDLYILGYHDVEIDESLIKVDNKAMLTKDYEKLLKKYQGKENSDYIIKQKLYQKGYSSEDINEII